MRQHKRWVLSLVFLLTVAGCTADSEVFYNDDIGYFYTRNLVNYTARDGSMPVVTYGNPFERLPSAAAGISDRKSPLPDGLTLPPYFNNIPLRHRLAEDDPAGRLVLLFDPEKPTTPQSLCTGNKVWSKPGKGRLVIQGAFCYNDKVATSVMTDMKRPANRNDPAYRRQMESMMGELFPFKGPNDGSCPNTSRC